jgi:hypothetical protein
VISPPTNISRRVPTRFRTAEATLAPTIATMGPRRTSAAAPHQRGPPSQARAYFTTQLGLGWLPYGNAAARAFAIRWVRAMYPGV